MLTNTSSTRPFAMIENLERRALFNLTPDPGSTFATAFNVGDLNGQTTLSDTVGPSDTTDIYKFSMPRAGQFFGRVRANNAPAEIALIQEQVDDNGTVHEVFLDSRDATQDGPDGGFASGDLPPEFLTAGNYFMIVTALGADTPYLIRMTADYAGNTLAAASDIGSVTDNSFQDFIGEFPTPSLNDPFDTYKFKMDAAGTFDVNFTLDSTDESTFKAHMALIQDVNGNNAIDPGDTIFSTLPGSNGHIVTRLNAGTYILRLSSDLNFSNYRLHMNADYAGTNPDTVRNLGSIEKLQSVNDFISASTDVFDDYKFAVSAPRSFFVGKNEQGGASTLELFKDNNHNGMVDVDELITSTLGSNFNVLEKNLSPGTYFLRIRGASGSGVYGMSLETRPDGAGNTLATAKNLGTSKGLNHVEEYVGSIDGADFYKFTAAASGTVGAALVAEFGGDADLALIRDANNNGKVDSNEILATGKLTSSGAKELSKSITPGNYFLRVTPRGPAEVDKYIMSFQTDYAGSTPKSARNVGSLSGTKNFDDWASGPFSGAISDTSDVYKFSLSSTKSFSAKLIGTLDGEDLDLQLFRDKNNDGVLSANEVVASSHNLNSPNEQIKKSLSAGTYFLRVVGVNGETNYHLTLNA